MNLLRNKKHNNLFAGLKKLRPGRAHIAWWSLSEWSGLVAMLVTLEIAVWAVDQAGWIRPSTSLVALLVFSVLAGFLLVKTGLPGFFFHPLALLAGLVVVFCLGLVLQPASSLAERTSYLISAIGAWWQAQQWGAPSPVTIHITLIFAYITWLIGYFSAWSLLKKGNPWTAVFLGTVVILVTLNFQPASKFYFFVAYAAAALAFLALVNYLKNRARLAGGEYRGGRSRPVYWLGTVVCLIVVTVSLAWINPGFKISAISNYAREHTPFKDNVELYWQSFFARVPGSGAPVLNHGGQQDLLFGGPLELSDQVVFIINSSSSHYWKTQVYDQYSSTGWQTGETETEDVPLSSASKPAVLPAEGDQLIYTLIPQVNTDVVPVAGEFLAASIAVKEKILAPRTYTLNLLRDSDDNLLPDDLALAAAGLRSIRNVRRRTDQQITALLPSTLKMESISRLGNYIQSITVSRLETEEKTVVSISSSQVLLQQKRVTVSAVIAPPPTAAGLKAAGTDYPHWITDRYLQLPSSLPERVRDLAAEITAEVETPYEKTQAVKEYLGKLSYDLNISAPPEGEDGVDYFLFTSESGYCNYFASAATVLLRSSGIPARMAVGFMPGEYDSGTHNYIVRDKDYHAWTEVYYPGLGWVELDATPPARGEIASSSGSSTADIPFFVYPDLPNPDTGPSAAATTQTQVKSQGSRNLILFFSFYILIVLAMIVMFQRASRPRSKTALYSRMVLLASLAGLGPRPRQTELEFSRQLSQAIPAQADTITHISGSYMASHYGRESAAASMDSEFKKTWPALRRALIKRIFRLR